MTLPQCGHSIASGRESSVQPMSDLVPGPYTVAWTSVSADDGHTAQGFYTFVVNGGPVGILDGTAQAQSQAADLTATLTVMPAPDGSSLLRADLNNTAGALVSLAVPQTPYADNTFVRDQEGAIDAVYNGTRVYLSLPLYQALAWQLGDTNGVAFTVETSLVSQPLAVTGTNLSNLQAWLGSILLYLQAVAGGSSGTVPAATQTLSFSLSGAAIWLGLMLTIALAASYVPARRAAEISVRSALAYE